MGIQILQEPEGASGAFGRGLGQGLAQAPKSIFEMISLHQKQKKEAYKNRETLSKGLPKYLKERHPALSENPKKIREIEGIAEKYLNEYEPLDAMKLAIDDVLGHKKGTKKTDPFSLNSPQENENGRHPSLGGTQPGFLEQLLQPGEGGQPGFLQKSGLLKSTENPIGSAPFLESLGLGGLVEPAEMLEQFTNPAKIVAEALGFQQQKRPSEMMREKIREGLSPEQQSQAEATELAGSFFPWGTVIGAFSKTSKLGSFWKSAQRAAKTEGIAVEKAAENIAKRAAETGIDATKVAAGDAAEVKRLNEFSKKSGFPEEAKTKRTFKETAKSAPKEEAKIRDDQSKIYPRFAEEVAEDQAKLAKQAARMKMPTTVAKEENIQKVAQQSIPEIRKVSINAGKRRRSIEDTFEKMVGPEKARAKLLLDEAVEIEKEADRALRNAIHAAETGELRMSTADLQKQIADSLKKIEEHSKKLEEPLGSVFSKTSPQRLEQQQKIKKLSPLPGRPYEDEYMRIKGSYKSAYQRRLKEVADELKDAHFLEKSQFEGLKREQKILQDRVSGIEADTKIHAREQGLRELEKAKKNKEKLQKSVPTKEGGKTETVAREKIREALKDLNSPQAEKIADKAGLKKEDLRAVLKDVKNGVEKINTSSKTQRPTLREINKFLEEIKKKNYWDALTKTPVGREILWTAMGLAYEEVSDEKMPWGALGGLVHAKTPGTAAIRSGLIYLYKRGRTAARKNSYRKSVEKGNDEEVASFKKKHPKLAKEVRSELL